MRDKADAWQMEIASITWEFKKLTEKLKSSELQYKPAPNVWSISDNISHLIQINSSYFRIFDQIIQGTYKPPLLAQLPYLPKAVGQLLHRAMTSKSKMKTFDKWQPLQVSEDILPQFKNHQMELSNYIQQLEPYLEKGIIIHSPASKLLPYQLDQAVNILVAHEKRHLNQCQNLVSAHLIK